MRDFTLNKYAELLHKVLSAGYPIFGIAAWLRTLPQAKAAIIRHDVDRRPDNAVKMATLESQMKVRTTYYFRMVGSAYCEDTIRSVARLGHEIGYHYEDLAVAKGNIYLAAELFRRNLAKLRRLASVETIAMHGSPMSSQNNLDIWTQTKMSDYSIIGDAFLSLDYREIHYFTDTGRGWNRSITNLRDHPPGTALINLDGTRTKDLIRFLSQNKIKKLALGVHPERWNNNIFAWVRQAVFDSGCNVVKAITNLIRARAVYPQK